MVDTRVEAVNESALSSAANTQRVVTILSIAALALGIVLAFFITRGIVRVLTRIIRDLADGARPRWPRPAIRSRAQASPWPA